MNWHKKGTTKIERIAYTELAVVSYSLLDVALYPAIARTHNETFMGIYRMVQGGIIASVNVILNKYLGLSSAIGFDLQLICGVPDLYYYGFYQKEFNDGMYHLSFTPMGMIQYPRPVTRADLWGQSIIGKGISISINL